MNDSCGIKDLNNCNFSKTVLMLFVVLCHSAAFWGGDWFTVCKLSQTNTFLGLLSSWLGTFHVTGFTLISGYIYYFLKKEKCKYNNFTYVLINKAKRLLIPYILVSLLWVVPLGNVFYNFSAADILHKFVLGESPSQLWFLLMLFEVFIIAELTFSRIKKIIYFVIILFVLGNVLPFVLPNVFQIFTSMKFLFFFYIGYYIRENYSYIIDKKKFIYGILFLCINVLSFSVVNIYNDSDIFIVKIILFIFSVISNVAGAIMAFLLLLYFATLINQGCIIFNLLSKLNFSIYLFHQQIIYVLLWYLNGKIEPFLMTFVNFSCSILLSGFIGSVLSKNKYSRLIIGDK